MFGDLIGYGDYGFVFADETEMNGPDGAVVKIMTLDTPGWECNLQQYNMFAQLMNHQDQGIRTPGLPLVFKHFRGQMDINLLNILSYMSKDTDPHAVRALRESIPAGSEYAVVIMEKLPCVATNQYCGRNLKDKGNIAEEQSVYESMVTYLYESGWWVRDVVDPRNVGYNIHGEPVWFDPMVARRRGYPGYNQEAIEMCHEEVAAYPSSYRKAVQDGSYFKERHGYGLFHSEAQTSNDLLHQAKNWPLIRDYWNNNVGRKGSIWDMDANTRSTDPQLWSMPNDIKILNSWEEWENMKEMEMSVREDRFLGQVRQERISASSHQQMFGKWYYINWPCTVYRGSLKRGIDYETYLEDTAIKPGGHSANMGYQNVIAAAPELSEALMFGAFSVNDEGDIVGHEASELYAFDIQDYVVTFPRLSTRGRSGRELPVIFIAGGVYHDDAILLWEKEAVLFQSESFVSRDYPQCYLCGLPAKIEVLTAVGMRNFCSNKCRGDYEGIDYGPDDYFISPKLEHQLNIVEYFPGLKLDYEKDIEAKVTIKCNNCPLHFKKSFDESHVTRRGDWHKHKDEEGNTMSKEEIGYCDHDMSIIKYISNDWDRSGVVTIRCPKCNLADETYADIPEGCSNKGNQSPKWFGAHDWEVSWDEGFVNPELGDSVDWDDNKYISTTGVFLSPEGKLGLQLRSQMVLSPNTWSGISGFLDAGETPYDGVIREIHEETGLPIDIISNWQHRTLWDDGSHRTYVFFVKEEFDPQRNEYAWEWDDFRWEYPTTWKQVSNLHPGMVAVTDLFQKGE